MSHTYEEEGKYNLTRSFYVFFLLVYGTVHVWCLFHVTICCNCIDVSYYTFHTRLIFYPLSFFMAMISVG